MVSISAHKVNLFNSTFDEHIHMYKDEGLKNGVPRPCFHLMPLQMRELFYETLDAIESTDKIHLTYLSE